MRSDLSDYGFMVAKDSQSILRLALSLAPVVPTGAAGLISYATFHNDAAFAFYNAKRGIGGRAQRISFGAAAANANLVPNALEIGMDKTEREQAGAAVVAVEQAKVKTLVNSAYNSFAKDVITVLKAGVTAQAGKGNWIDGNIDPIDEIDEQIEAISRYMMPNKIVMDIGAWRKAKNHPKVTKRFGTSKGVTLGDFAGLLLNPSIAIELTDIAFNTYGFDNSTGGKTAALGAEVWVCCSQESPSPFDPSFAKVFATRKELFDGIGQYYEDQTRSDIYAMDWNAIAVVVSSLLGRRLVIT